MALREANLLSVISVGSSKPPATKPSVSKKPTKKPAEDGVAQNPTPVEDEIVVCKEEEDKPDHGKNEERDPNAERISNREPMQTHSETEEERQDPPAQTQDPLYEAWVLYHEIRVTISKVIKLLGIKLKIETNERNHYVQFAQIHAEQEEIKTLISQLRAKKPKDTRQPTMPQQLNALGPELATDVSHLVLDRINQTGNPKWFLELHTPWTKSQKLGSTTHSLIT
ncbi:hypothetical protein BDZ45DRAFT_327397 [Acephala macrosclerotiorum]|nr:hypothetical protein BDZ45DRAFT_327397 [Acephala macrosclerotiorum]